MPHTSTARKNLRKTQKRRLHNRAVIRDLKLQIKKVMTASESGTVEQLAEEYRLAAKKLDKAAAKRTVHRNMAARKKSQLARLLNAKKAAAK